jgi:hypothetical protein
MQTYTISGSAWEGGLLPSWHTASAPVTPERIAGVFTSLPPLTRYEVDRLHRMGVPMGALMGPPPLKVGYVVFSERGFEFEQHCPLGVEGMRALIFLILNRQGEAWDLVAWCSRTGQLASWLGRAWAIGEDTIYDVRLSDHGALPVWRDPLRLLQANGEGIVLVRSRMAVHYLADAEPLLAEDTWHGEELQQILTRRCPRIIVPAPKELAA